ncbi:hypothetical protein FSARC_8217 [Fusarium sarcochroum]|uniref:Uncharacterized protein n=1 Tax=Fusarium sarcochroum TaxID=1208366 RepID=A0A8H4TTJ4_9HYPO|nr:hypothetical protein FSARC_8217 [Fusarium sarcochroum]
MSSLPGLANGQQLAGSQPEFTGVDENNAGNNQPQSLSNTSSGVNPVPNDNNQANDGQNQDNDVPMDGDGTSSGGNDEQQSSSNTSSGVNLVPNENNQGNDGQNQGNDGQNQGSNGQNQGNDGQNQGSNGQNQGSNGQNQGSNGQNQGNVPPNQGNNGQNQGNDGQGQGTDTQPINPFRKRGLESPQSQQRQGGNTGPFTPSVNRPAKKIKFGHQECPVEDDDLEAELPNQTTPAHMKTMGKVKMHGTTHYVNEYKQNGRRIFRIQSIKEPSVSDASLKQLNHKDYQSKYAERPWAEVRYVEGICTFGAENDHTNFLSQLDPENLEEFVTPNVVLIRIKWSNDNEVAYVNRVWWRRHYQPLDLGSKRRFATSFKKDHPEWEFTADEIRTAFKDSRLYRWAFKYEQLYYKTTNADAPFSPEKRAKSLSPTMEQEIRKYREATISPSRKQPNANVYQSIEQTPAPESDYGDDESLHDSQSHYRSSTRPAATPGAPHLVDQNGSPRPPRSGRLPPPNQRSQRPRRSQRSRRSLFTQPNRFPVAAY